MPLHEELHRDKDASAPMASDASDGQQRDLYKQKTISPERGLVHLVRVLKTLEGRALRSIHKMSTTLNGKERELIYREKCKHSIVIAEPLEDSALRQLLFVRW